MLWRSPSRRRCSCFRLVAAACPDGRRSQLETFDSDVKYPESSQSPGKLLVLADGFCQLAVETRKKTRQGGRKADTRTGSLIRLRVADPQFHAIV
jgi:hypothetical protein